MKLIIISGRSGSGKSTALRALEDAGFSCIDNFPVELLPSLVSSVLAEAEAPRAFRIQAWPRTTQLSTLRPLRSQRDCRRSARRAASDPSMKS